jgi:hypothetical protein
MIELSAAFSEVSMGAWGHGIRQDDFVCDVIGAFEDQLKAGNSLEDATTAVKSKFAADLDDSDNGPLFWIALADVQWTYGDLRAPVFQRVKEDFDSGRSLALWNEDPRELSRRKAALEKFINKVSAANRRPRKLPKIVVRPPRFQPGDCLSICLSNGKYGAAIVLAIDHSNVEYGLDFVAILDYLFPEKPTLSVFQERKWLRLTHHNWDNEIEVAWHVYVGFQKVRHRLEVIGKVDLLDSDPEARKEGVKYTGWADIGEQVIRQHEWDERGGSEAAEPSRD